MTNNSGGAGNARHSARGKLLSLQKPRECIWTRSVTSIYSISVYNLTF